LADPLLVGEPDPHSTATSPSPTAHRPATAAHGSATTSRPATIPNGRKGYKLTLWVSPTTEDGLADAHGLLQL
jgi:hypothetical protein